MFNTLDDEGNMKIYRPIHTLQKIFPIAAIFGGKPIGFSQ